MKRRDARTLLALLPAIAMLPFPAAGAPTELHPGTRIRDGVTTLEVDLDAAPEVADWNNDGRKDLIVGEFWDGKVRLYLNQGTSANPVFSGYSFIQSGGVDITTEYG